VERPVLIGNCGSKPLCYQARLLATNGLEGDLYGLLHVQNRLEVLGFLTRLPCLGRGEAGPKLDAFH